MNTLLPFASKILQSNFKELALPYRITYIVTSRCQCKCSMCSIWKKPATNELTLQEINTFFQKSNQFLWVNLSGGEIFLRKDILNIIEAICTNCRQLSLLDFPTNGLLSDTIVQSVEKIISRHRIPKLMVTVSLDGPRELHDAIRGTPGLWDRALDTFRRLRALRSKNFNVFLGFTLQPANSDKFEETFQAVKNKIPALSYNDFHVNIFQHSTHYYANSQPASPVEYERLWESLHRIMAVRKASFFNPIALIEKRYQSLARIFLSTHRTPLPCQALSSSCFMDPTGLLYPCSIYDRPFGNIRDFDYDIRKAWKSALRTRLRKEINAHQCPHCWTPCEAYQTILANIIPKFNKR